MERRQSYVKAYGTKVVFGPGLINFDDLKRPEGGVFYELMAEERNRDVARAIRKAYSDLESSFEEFRFPDSKYFSHEKFISKLEKTSWKYDKISRDARKPIGLEKIPDLLMYDGNKTGDIEKVVNNAEKRIRDICSSNGSEHIMFSSSKHGEVLSQELYEAGWDWHPKY